MQPSSILNSDNSPRAADKLFKNIIKKAHKAIKSPDYHPDTESYQAIATLIQNTEFFTKKLDTSSKLKEFIQEARHHFKYEVHDYATAIMREKEYADKFYIILEGNVQKIQQRPSSELDQELNRMGTLVPSLEKIGKSSSFRKKRTECDEPIPSIVFKRECSRSQTRKQINRRNSPVVKTAIALPDSPNTMKLDPEMNCASIRLDTDNLETEPDYKTSTSLFAIKPFSVKDIPHIPANSKTQAHIVSKETHKELLGSGDGSIVLPSKRMTRGADKKTSFYVNERGSIGEILETKDQYQSDTLTKEECEFIRNVALENSDLEDRLFYDDVIRVNIAKIFGPGEYFGENFCRARQPRENAIMAVSSQQVHLLSISKESYNSILDNLQNWIQQRAGILQQVLHKFDEEVVREFSYSFSNKRFTKGEVIFSQGDASGDIYLVHSGDVRLSKETDFKPPSSLFATTNGRLTSPKAVRKMDVPLVTVPIMHFFGEEVLLKEPTRQYTATVNSTEVQVLILEEHLYHEISQKYADLFKAITNQAQGSFNYRQQRLTSMLKKQQSQVLSPVSYGTFFVEPPKINNNLAISQPIYSLQTEVSSPKFRSSMPDLDMEASNHTPIRSFLRKTSVLVDEEPKIPTVAVQSPVSSSVYKTKFSRKFNIQPKQDQDNKYVLQTEIEEDVEMNARLHRDFVEFNIRKELQESKDGKDGKKKLPKIPPKSPNASPKKPADLLQVRSLRSSLSNINSDLLSSPLLSPTEKPNPKKDETKGQKTEESPGRLQTFPIFGSKKDMIRMKSISLTKFELETLHLSKSKKKRVDKLVNTLKSATIHCSMKC